MTTGTPLPPPFRLSVRMRPAALALALACGACAPGSGHHPAALHLAAAAVPGTPWWETAGDPLLAQLVTQGLRQDGALLCRSDALARREGQAHARKLTIRLSRLIAPQDNALARQADAYALAAARGHAATRIALAYVEVRRWQARIALRNHALDPLRDNAEIARFRREAGLVSALDGDMADVMTGLDRASMEAARAHLSDAIAELSRLTGALPDDLRQQLGPDGAVPMFMPTAGAWDLSHRADLMALHIRLRTDLARHKVSQQQWDAQLADPDRIGLQPLRAAVAQWHKAQTAAQAEIDAAVENRSAAQARIAPLAQNAALALRAVGDARLAYRAGTEHFATLYVAEGMALAAQERRIDADALLASATLAFWEAQGLGWSQSDLTPAPSGTTCDQP